MVELFREFFWMVFPVGGMSIGVLAIVLHHIQRQKTLEVLRSYAEQGKEPPAAVVDALARDSTRDRPYSTGGGVYGLLPLTRVRAWASTAFFAMMAAGFAGATLIMPAVRFPFFIVAFVMAAVAASRLVMALSLPPSDGRE